MASNLKWFNLYSFAGLNTLINEEILKPSYSPDAKNVITEGGIVKTRNGYLALNATGVAFLPALGVAGYYSVAGVKKFGLFCDTKMYAWNPTTRVFDNIATGLTAAPWHFEWWVNLLLCANGTDMKKYDGSTLADLAAPPGKYLRVHQERLLVANQADNKSRVSWSQIGNPEGWVDDSDSGDLDVQTNDGDEITALHPFDQDTLVFKERSFWILAGSEPKNYRFMGMGGPGTVAHRTVRTVGGRPFWLARDGVYAFNGSVSYCVSEEIDPYFIRNINQDHIGKAAAVEWRRRYWLAVPWGDSTVNNVVLVYDPSTRLWYFFEGIYAACFAKFKMDNQELLYFGTSQDEGKVYQADTGTTDNGQAIDAHWWTPWLNFENPVSYKKISKVRCLINTYAEPSGKLAVSYRKDGGLEASPKHLSLLNADGVQNPTLRTVPGLDIGAARCVKLKFAGPEFQLDGFTIEHEVLPQREGAE